MSTTRRPGCLLILGRLLICDGVSGADDDAVSVLSRMGMLPRLLLASHTLLGQSPEQWLAYLLNKNISVSNEGSYQGARGWLVGWAWLLAVAGSWVDGHARRALSSSPGTLFLCDAAALVAGGESQAHVWRGMLAPRTGNRTNTSVVGGGHQAGCEAAAPLYVGLAKWGVAR